MAPWDLDLVESFYVGEVLGTAGRALVANERVEADDAYLDIAERPGEAIRPRVGEAQSRELRENVDTPRRHTDLIRHPLAREVRFRETACWCSECGERLDDALCVRG